MIFNPRRMVVLLLLPAVMLVIGGGGVEERSRQPATVRHIEPDERTGTSMATVVGDVPLIHTDQFLAFDPEGALVGRSDLDQQVRRAMDNLRLALAEVGAEFRDLAKLNVYVTRDEAKDRVLALLPSILGAGARPAISFVASTLPHPEALVALDAVAVAPGAASSERITRRRSEAVYGFPEQAHLAILPPGGKVYLSGQAARGDDLIQATRETMKGLHATLAYLGLSADDVVQVKAFYTPMDNPEEVERVIAEYYRGRPAPPVLSVEWVSGSLPTEIELIAYRRPGTEAAAGEDAVSYITPPGTTPSAVFSRVAEVHGGDLVFISGLYPDAGLDAETQVRSVFSTLGRLLREAGSDFHRLVKATYYVSEDGTSRAMNAIRPDFYDPARPPAASKISVRSVGKQGTGVTLDMIGVAVK